MKVDVVDTIMFPNTQTYNSYDELYQRFVGGIQNTVNGKTLGQQFPSGSSELQSSMFIQEAELPEYTINIQMVHGV